MRRPITDEQELIPTDRALLDKLIVVPESFAMFIVPCLASIVTHYLPIAKSLGVLLFLLVEVAFVGCAAIGFLQPVE